MPTARRRGRVCYAAAHPDAPGGVGIKTPREDGVAKRSRQSILKRQREVKKAEKAAQKREKRAARKEQEQEQGGGGAEIDYAFREEIIAEAASMFSDVPKGLGAGEES